MLARTLTFSPDQDESFFQELPASAAVFVLHGDGEPYVSKSANLRHRLMRLLGPPREKSKRLNLRDRVREVEFTTTGSDFESQFLLYQILRGIFPKTHSARLRLRFAPLVKLHLENEYPRASVTTRLGKISLVSLRDESSGDKARFDSAAVMPRLEAVFFQSSAKDDCGVTGVSPVQLDANRKGEDARASKVHSGNLYYGPFPSRAAAEKFASDALDFFKMRRCVDDLHPDPSFPGCVYSEMKMCLAPCFKGCTDSDYHAEVARVQAFFDTAGDSFARELAQQRDQASTKLAFEDAAAIHAKIEKLKPLLAQLPEIVQRIDRLDAIVIQPSAEPGSVSLFRFSSGCLHGPVLFSAVRSGHVGTAAAGCPFEPSSKPGGESSLAESGLRPEGQPRAAVPTLPQVGTGSLESRVEAIIRSFPVPEAKSAVEGMEHLAILKRWYYRSSRIGEIFFADEKGAWPLRRIVRGIGRVYRGEKLQEPANSATQPSPLPSQGL